MYTWYVLLAHLKFIVIYTQNLHLVSRLSLFYAIFCGVANCCKSLQLHEAVKTSVALFLTFGLGFHKILQMDLPCMAHKTFISPRKYTFLKASCWNSTDHTLYVLDSWRGFYCWNISTLLNGLLPLKAELRQHLSSWDCAMFVNDMSALKSCSEDTHCAIMFRWKVFYIYFVVIATARIYAY